ncbi:MAG TPA: hypothetical protein PLX02_05785 [Syntrophorhabdaceae bacterium]|nr:hypothetical protein [Syntrophorhabdaceae bacterium]HQM81116.1 hypothetical protein [Syntrophorhabdaceae bacterium]
MMKRAGAFCMVCILAAATIFMAGCGREESRTITTPEGKVTVTTKQEGGKEVVKVETKQGSVTIKAGAQAVSEAELGAPIYPGAEVVSSGQFGEKRDAAAGIASVYAMTTNDNYDKVVSFYKKNLKNIQQTMDQTIGDQKMTMFMSGKKGDMRNVQIIAKTSGGPTNIHVTKIMEK